MNRKPIQMLIHLIPWLVFVVLLSITYANFFIHPYLGFVFDGSRRISNIQSINTPIEEGDLLIKFDHFTLKEFYSPPRSDHLRDYSPGDVVDLVIQKASGEILHVKHTITGFTAAQFLDRLIGLWPLPYLFWLCGTATFLLIRPRDPRWVLFIATNYLTAIWFSAGSTLSKINLWHGPIVLRAFVWMTIPVFINLHFEFFKKPDYVYPKLAKIGMEILYVIFFSLAFLEIFFIPPSNLYKNAFLVTVVLSIIYLIVQYYRVEAIQRAIKIIFFSSLIAFLPIILITLFAGQITNWNINLDLTVVVFPILPFSYFIAIFGKRFGDFEFRANRLITLYLYSILVITASIVILGVISLAIDVSASYFLSIILSMFAVSLVTALYYGKFQQFVERKILGINIPEKEILKEHLSHISTTLDSNQLAANIQNYFLPSLLIRQSAILNIEDQKITKPLFTYGISNDQLPDTNTLDLLLEYQERYIYPGSSKFTGKMLSWIRLALPLTFNNELIGLWLFGGRDPDNFYAAQEIETFNSVAAGTAIAMINIEQSENLVHLYRSRISREEANRARLSRDIHDIPLNNLAAIKKNIPNKKIDTALTGVINDLRLIIRDLRPPLITFGLITALDDLANRLNSQQDEVEVTVEIDDSSAEINEKITIQVYRIARQACENALKHAQCKNILIQGQITSDFIVINVIDDGIGFENAPGKDFKQLLEQKSYGIVGMHERASLIGASLQINSEQGSGSVVSFIWKK